MSRCVGSHNALWLEKSRESSNPPITVHRLPGGPVVSMLDAVVATSGPGIESGIFGPLSLSSLPLIKPDSWLGPRNRSKFWFLSGRREVEMGGRELGQWTYFTQSVALLGQAHRVEEGLIQLGESWTLQA